MSIFRVLLYIFLAIFLYKFVFNFLVPVIKMSWRVRSQIKEFQRQHQQQEDPLQQNTTANNRTSSPPHNHTASKPKAGDYIDFEDVKE
ncbi:hypothetical protein A4H97_28990 [Niastella yeongjuensis]|uniref:DUF4834 domain-containing protein n=1 Tax=Niastella yeongjuensis TaxID=354355 RepID=A0A1V9ET97_9BACT|nr:DUF4834 family protein [Niastella yeongjuensis]OQP49376.1 hypothetical protein A4H97_28990 [Niastella yeongjuensis]SEP43704.1 protein of unknown function [Niastella yeongjuensis]